MDSADPNSPLKILLAYDGSEHSLAALDLLIELPLPAGSVVSLIGVINPRRPGDEERLGQGMEQASRRLQERGATASASLRRGDPAEQILAAAEAENPGLIVVGAQGLRATLGILLGGVAQQVAEYAGQPTLVVRAPWRPVQRLLLVIDGSPHSQRALEFLAHFPLPQGCQVVAVHVLPPMAPPEWVARAWPLGPEIIPPLPSYLPSESSEWQKAEEAEAQALLDGAVAALNATGLAAKSALLHGDAASEVIAYARAQQAGLIVCGSRGLSPVRRWLLGSVSRKLIHYADCSVLIVRSPGG